MQLRRYCDLFTYTSAFCVLIVYYVLYTIFKLYTGENYFRTIRVLPAGGCDGLLFDDMLTTIFSYVMDPVTII